MSVTYKQFISISPIVIAPSQKLKQALKFNQKIKNEADYKDVKQKAVDDILNATSEDEPSEINRLRLLYKEVYSKEELEKLVDAILKDYGISEN